jgi:hypothetical protein
VCFVSIAPSGEGREIFCAGYWGGIHIAAGTAAADFIKLSAMRECHHRALAHSRCRKLLPALRT